jgi:hypothetical protein
MSRTPRIVTNRADLEQALVEGVPVETIELGLPDDISEEERSAAYNAAFAKGAERGRSSGVQSAVLAERERVLALKSLAFPNPAAAQNPSPMTQRKLEELKAAIEAGDSTESFALKLLHERSISASVSREAIE